MFRSNEMSKMNNELDQEDNYEFTGATLKISSGDSPEIGLRNRGSKTYQAEKSAILSGSEPSSPVHEYSRDTYTPIGNNNDETATLSDTEVNTTSNNKDVNAGQFFSFRPGQFERAVNDCVNTLLRPSNDTNVLGSWLLTEISHWDHERERLFVLTSKTLLDVKYDFIALKIVQHNKVRLNQIDTVLKGKLTYPPSSLMPKIEGITNGVTSLICGSLFCKSNQRAKNPSVSFAPTNRLAIANRFDFSCFNPVERKEFGIRVLWNKGQPLPIFTSWNPFAEDIPWKTVKNHPVFYTEGKEGVVRDALQDSRHIYSVESFYNALAEVFSNANPDGVDFNCDFKEGPILMENYVGLGAVIHNKNNFGFFKVRGKFSF